MAKEDGNQVLPQNGFNETELRLKRIQNFQKRSRRHRRRLRFKNDYFGAAGAEIVIFKVHVRFI
ncbi:MAG: hypothetical protein H6563_05840 [Lewinellaceae bacterium]|nr:hypothetical protein [Lewinellaceae bacterium]